MLIDSLVLSRLMYALPVWGPLLSQFDIWHLQYLHNWGVCITASIGRFDHVSEYHSKLHWLTVSSLIKYRCLCALHKIYHGDGIVLDPPITFGTSNTYCTRSSNRFIQPELCRQSHTKKLFRHSVTHWWNDLPEDVLFSHKFPSTLYDF